MTSPSVFTLRCSFYFMAILRPILFHLMSSQLPFILTSSSTVIHHSNPFKNLPHLYTFCDTLFLSSLYPPTSFQCVYLPTYRKSNLHIKNIFVFHILDMNTFYSQISAGFLSIIIISTNSLWFSHPTNPSLLTLHSAPSALHHVDSSTNTNQIDHSTTIYYGSRGGLTGSVLLPRCAQQTSRCVVLR